MSVIYSCPWHPNRDTYSSAICTDNSLTHYRHLLAISELVSCSKINYLSVTVSHKIKNIEHAIFFWCIYFKGMTADYSYAGNREEKWSNTSDEVFHFLLFVPGLGMLIYAPELFSI